MSEEHKSIPNDQLHEVKGASSARAGEFLKGRGDGTSEFSPAKVKFIDEMVSEVVTQQTVQLDGTPLNIAAVVPGTSSGGSIQGTSDGKLKFNDIGVFNVVGYVNVLVEGTKGDTVTLAFRAVNGGTQLTSTKLETLEAGRQHTVFVLSQPFEVETAGFEMYPQVLVLEKDSGITGVTIKQSGNIGGGFSKTPAVTTVVSYLGVE